MGLIERTWQQPLRLDGRQRRKVLRHLLALDGDDRFGRFATPLADAAIAAYVDCIDFAQDLCFGSVEADGELSGFIHLARFDDFAELGASVSAGCRCQGRARQLFRAALAEAQRQGLREIHLAAGHPAARHICRTLGYAMRESTTYPRVRVALC